MPAADFKLTVVSQISTAYIRPTTFEVRAVIKNVISQGGLKPSTRYQCVQDLIDIYHHYNLAIPQDIGDLAVLAVAGPQPMAEEAREDWHDRLIALMGFEGMSNIRWTTHIEDNGEIEHTTVDVAETLETSEDGTKVYGGYTAHLGRLLEQLTDIEVAYCCDLGAIAVQKQGTFVSVEGKFEGQPVQINYYAMPQIDDETKTTGS